ncbi:MAG: site-2 protease family protein [Candidatus Hodarchaeales archaeon]|jgi:membrane-associated protease RseP (regulator of RpoE activity)
MNMEEENQDKNDKRVDFSFPMLLIRTQVFNRIFNRLGTLKVSKIFSWVALVLVPIIAGFGLFIIFTSLFTLLSTPAVADITRELGPGAFLLIPGINPFLPIFYGLFAIICAMFIHEGAHGIAARSLGFRIKSSGLLFILFVPFGAFVDVDEKQIEKAKPKRAIRVMAAGVGANIVIAAACLIGLIVIVNGLVPVIDGVYINSVEEGLPAETAGLLPNDVFLSINNITISNNQDVLAILEDKTPGEIIQVTVARGDMWEEEFSTSMNLIKFENRTRVGISFGNIFSEEKLNLFKTITPQTLVLYLVPPSIYSSIIPYSDAQSSFYTHGLGNQWSIIANILFWLSFVNGNLAIFNALPLYPLDGGRIFNITLKSIMGNRWDKKRISQVTTAVTIAIFLVIILPMIIPFIT